MKFALNLPNFGPHADVETLAELAATAESAGWDGFFLWDHVLSEQPDAPFVDPWVAMAAIAISTQRVRLGAMVTPLPRRRPWQVARETVSLDHLSGGRLIFGAGIGGDGWREYSAFGEDPDARRHGAMLDEALDVLTGLWSGETFSYEGEHYTIRDARFMPTPAQSPRIPVWVAGLWPNKRPFRRAARWDGVFPIGRDAPLEPDDVRAMVAYMAEHRTGGGSMDIAVSAPNAIRDRASLAAYEEAGATWWIQDGVGDGPAEQLQDRISQGPPRP